MKRIFTIALCAVAAAGLLAGCEWSTSSEHNESWNDSYNWVNFSGTYRSSSGGILVTDYTTMSSGSTNNYNTTESGGSLADGQTSASGTTQHKPIIPGSFSVVVGDVTLSDNGSGAGMTTGSCLTSRAFKTSLKKRGMKLNISAISSRFVIVMRIPI